MMFSLTPNGLSHVSSFLLYGPPASGKTTLARGFSRATGVSYVSVGEITRSEMKRGTPLGFELEGHLMRVEEYPPALIGKLVEKNVTDIAHKGGNFILDGFPKYAGEARFFLELQERLRFDIQNVIVVDLSLEKVLERVAHRRICSRCLTQYDLTVHTGEICSKCGIPLVVREDDSREVLMRRFCDYDTALREVLDIIGERCGPVLHVDGTKDREWMLQYALETAEIRLPE